MNHLKVNLYMNHLKVNLYMNYLKVNLYMNRKFGPESLVHYNVITYEVCIIIITLNKDAKQYYLKILTAKYVLPRKRKK